MLMRPARRRGNVSLGGLSPTVEEWVLRTGHADPTPSDAFPANAVRRVARDGRSSTPVSPARRRSVAAKCAWKRHGVTFPAEASLGGVSPTVEASVSAHQPRGSHKTTDGRPPTGCAGSANDRRRRDGVSGQNAEPATSAKAKPGLSAMTVTNNAGDAFCHAELRVCGTGTARR